MYYLLPSCNCYCSCPSFVLCILWISVDDCVLDPYHQKCMLMIPSNSCHDIYIFKLDTCTFRNITNRPHMTRLVDIRQHPPLLGFDMIVIRRKALGDQLSRGRSPDAPVGCLVITSNAKVRPKAFSARNCKNGEEYEQINFISFDGPNFSRTWNDFEREAGPRDDLEVWSALGKDGLCLPVSSVANSPLHAKNQDLESGFQE